MNKKKWVILDRDGTIIEEKNYLHRPEQVVLLPGVAEGLRFLYERGYVLTVVTNQSGVGRGYFAMDDVDRVHCRLTELLAERGIALQGIYVCPHRPEERCACRKPAVGLISRASADCGLNNDNIAAVIGDKESDMKFGKNLASPVILLMSGYGRKERARGVSADFYAENLPQAARWLWERQE
ncbi:D-glycero-alpha-D-manno-heptose-1,7-bisphosphate 7-phosphatase [Pyramidobacter piscolens]|uniref:D-glycero-alpha-D-manno-heptose-1,7-bisphosphate 7-phosphatase n=1 Tax=Pyramidobacter piscolens TaxID=638849 RepID=UPI0026DFCE54|nr:HAD family hydrolase [Pyramidobacter piscolens]